MLLNTNKPLIIELGVAEDLQYDWGTGTCDMGTVVERWFVQPTEEQTNCFFSNSVGSVYSDHHHHHQPLRGVQPPVLGEMGTSCRQLKSHLRSKTKPITIMRVINGWNGFPRESVGS